MAIPSPHGQESGRKLLRLATRCATTEEFFTTFSRFVDETSVVILTSQPRPVGTRQPILVQLSGGEAMMRGEAEVVEVRTQPRGMMRLKLLAVDERTREVHRELLHRARKLQQEPKKTIPPPIPADVTPPPRRAASEGEAAKNGHTKEERVPGATYTLPANPFGELPDQALELFIECTLYEETGSFPIEGLGDALGGVPAAIVTQPSSAIPAPIAHEPSTAMIIPSGTFASIAPMGPPSLAQSGAVNVPTILAPHPPLPPKVEPMPARPRTLAEDGRSTDELAASLVRKRSAWPFVILTAALAGAAGFAGGFLSRDSAKPAPAAATAPVPVAAPATAPAPAPDPAPPTAPATPIPPPNPKPTAVSAPAPAPADAPTESPRPPPSPPPAADACTLDVTTEPPEVDVFAGELRLGKTPVRNATIPCAAVVPIVLNHPRYEKVERALKPKPGQLSQLDVRMQRPEGKLSLTSSPPGATFRVGGKSVGRAPTASDVLSFTHVKVEAELTGYKPWSERVYVRGRTYSVTARLEALPRKPGAKPTGPVSKPPKKGGRPDL